LTSDTAGGLAFAVPAKQGGLVLSAQSKIAALHLTRLRVLGYVMMTADGPLVTADGPIRITENA
jgi:hypothetical protein